MVVLHYVNLDRNSASGVSVIVPQIMNAQSSFATVGFYNYGSDSFETVDEIVRIKDHQQSDDYHSFPAPFNRPDLVVFQSPFDTPRCAWITLKLKRDGIPYIIVPHGCFTEVAMKKKWLKKKAARLIFVDRVVRDAAAMQYLSGGEKKTSVYTGESFVVANGISVPAYAPKEKKAEILKIAFIGRKDLYHKGLDLLIEACAIAKDRLKDKVQINLYGPATAEQAEAMKNALAEHGVEDFVADLPGVFGEEKKRVYMDTDVFVLTSRFEGHPVAILEAWSHGIPTLVTPGTNVAQECARNRCGWAVDCNAASIADALADLTEKGPEISQYAQNARHYVEKVYSWENIGRQYQTAYEAILEKGRK